MKRLKDISSDDYARERAHARERAEHDWASMLSDARREGLAEGKAGRTMLLIHMVSTCPLVPGILGKYHSGHPLSPSSSR
jgi:hypothetical protein